MVSPPDKQSPPLDEAAILEPSHQRGNASVVAFVRDLTQDKSRAYSLLLGVAAYLLALIGTLSLQDESRRNLGAIALVVSGLMALAAWRAMPATTIYPLARPNLLSVSKESAPYLAGVIGSWLLIALADASFLANQGETFGLAGWLWLLGMGLLVVSTVAIPRVSYGTTSEEDRQLEHQRASASHKALPWTRWEVLVFAGLVILALVLRLWDLAGYPNNIYGDEVAIGIIAVDSYMNKSGPPIFTTLWQTIDLPALWFLLVEKSLEIGNATLAALRLPTAMIGALTVVPFYGLLRTEWGRVAAVVGTAMLAFSAANIHYSRTAIVNIVTQFFWVLCFFFLLRGLRSGRPVYWALAGLTAGISEYGYAGTRLLPFILIAFFVYLLVIHRRQVSHYLDRFALVGLGYVAGMGPLLMHFLLQPGLYLGRGVNPMMWWQNPAMEDPQQLVATVWHITSENLLGISTHPSQDVIYFAPLLFPIEAALLPLGFALLFRQWRYPSAFLVLLSLLGVLVVGGTIVNYSEPPFLAHWAPAFPFFYAAMAIPVAYLARSACASLPRRLQWVAPALLIVALLWVGWTNVTFYFQKYYANADILKTQGFSMAQRGLELQTAEIRYQSALGPNYTVLIVGQVPEHFNPGVWFLAGDQDWGIMPDPQTELPALDAKGKGLGFIFFPESEHHLTLVRAQYPSGEQREVRNPKGTLLFTTYTVPSIRP